MREYWIEAKGLEPVETAALLQSHQRSIMAAVVFRYENHIRVVMGDGSEYDVPLDFFTPCGDGTTPDFSRMSVTDYGHTIAFGDYEASVLYLVETFAKGQK
jgi:hypothetical protein